MAGVPVPDWETGQGRRGVDRRVGSKQQVTGADGPPAWESFGREAEWERRRSTLPDSVVEQIERPTLKS